MIVRAALALAWVGRARAQLHTPVGTVKTCDTVDELGVAIELNFANVVRFGRALTGAKSMFATDLDGDGDVDVLVAYNAETAVEEGFHWYEADPSKTTDGYRWREVEYGVSGAYAVHAGDIDGDGETDVLAGTDNFGDSRVAWYQNITLFQATKDSDFHDRNAGGTEWVNTKYSDPKFLYGVSSGGMTYNAVHGVRVADVDGDGEADVLAAIYGDGNLAYYYNDGNEAFTSSIKLNTNAFYWVECVFAADVNGDGRVDVVAGERYLNKGVAWYENNGCSGGPPCGASTTFTEHVITNTLTETVATYAVDFDVDGDVDLMAASSSDGKIALYLNDGSHDFSPTTPTDDPDTTEIILSEWATGATALDVADFNGDGHLDVVFAGEQLGGCQFGEGRQCTLPDDSPRNCGMGNGNCDDMVVYYLNRGTSPPTFYENQIKTLSPLGAGPEYFVQAIDVDDDGDVDVMLGSTQLEQPRWYENDCAGAPTPKPTGGFPSLVPLPVPTSVPSTVPTSDPTGHPTLPPTALPTAAPTTPPSPVPTVPPTAVPTAAPTTPPSPVPTVPPTAVPTGAPTSEPTGRPTVPPTALPTGVPTTLPSSVPTVPPTPIPAPIPTPAPTPRPSVRCSAGVTFSTEHRVETSGMYLNVQAGDGAKIKVARRLPRPSARRRGTG